MGIIRDIWEFGDRPELETTSGPPKQASEGNVQQTFTFHATRVNAGRVESRLREMAEAYDLECEVAVGSGLLLRTIEVDVTGDQDSVSEFQGASEAMLNPKGATNSPLGG